MPADGLHRLFPTAAQIAETGFELLRGPQRRIDSIRAAAAAMGSGDLDFGYGDDLPGLQAKLLPMAGVGPWTVGYVAMRVIGAPDVFLANDAAVRNGIRALLPSAAERARRRGRRRRHGGRPESPGPGFPRGEPMALLRHHAPVARGSGSACRSAGNRPPR